MTKRNWSESTDYIKPHCIGGYDHHWFIYNPELLEDKNNNGSCNSGPCHDSQRHHVALVLPVNKLTGRTTTAKEGMRIHFPTVAAGSIDRSEHGLILACWRLAAIDPNQYAYYPLTLMIATVSLTSLIVVFVCQVIDHPGQAFMAYKTYYRSWHVTLLPYPGSSHSDLSGFSFCLVYLCRPSRTLSNPDNSGRGRFLRIPAKRRVGHGHQVGFWHKARFSIRVLLPSRSQQHWMVSRHEEVSGYFCNIPRVRVWRKHKENQSG